MLQCGFGLCLASNGTCIPTNNSTCAPYSSSEHAVCPSSLTFCSTIVDPYGTSDSDYGSIGTALINTKCNGMGQCDLSFGDIGLVLLLSFQNSLDNQMLNNFFTCRHTSIVYRQLESLLLLYNSCHLSNTIVLGHMYSITIRIVCLRIANNPSNLMRKTDTELLDHININIMGLLCAAILCDEYYAKNTCDNGHGATLNVSCGIDPTEGLDVAVYYRTDHVTGECQSDADCLTVKNAGPNYACVNATSTSKLQCALLAPSTPSCVDAAACFPPNALVHLKVQPTLFHHTSYIIHLNTFCEI
jgi:hypothetical protein